MRSCCRKLRLSAGRPFARDERRAVADARREARWRQTVCASVGARRIAAAGGARGPAFLTLQNFRVIMKYNPAEAYALAIGHLADRLAGGAPFVQTWPRDLRALSSAERIELQQLLARAGSMPARRTGCSARAPALPSAIFRWPPARCPMAMPRVSCWTVCVSSKGPRG